MGGQSLEPFQDFHFQPGDLVESNYEGQGKWLPAKFHRKSSNQDFYYVIYDYAKILTKKEHVRPRSSKPNNYQNEPSTPTSDVYNNQYESPTPTSDVYISSLENLEDLMSRKDDAGKRLKNLQKELRDVEKEIARLDKEIKQARVQGSSGGSISPPTQPWQQNSPYGGSSGGSDNTPLIITPTQPWQQNSSYGGSSGGSDNTLNVGDTVLAKERGWKSEHEAVVKERTADGRYRIQFSTGVSPQLFWREELKAYGGSSGGSDNTPLIITPTQPWQQNSSYGGSSGGGSSGGSSHGQYASPKRTALIITVSYVNQKGALPGTINDGRAMSTYLQREGYTITWMRDDKLDARHKLYPNKANIKAQIKLLARTLQTGM